MKIRKHNKNATKIMKVNAQRVSAAPRVVLPFSEVIEKYVIPDSVLEKVNSKQSEYYVIGKTSDETWEVQFEKNLVQHHT